MQVAGVRRGTSGANRSQAQAATRDVAFGCGQVEAERSRFAEEVPRLAPVAL